MSEEIILPAVLNGGRGAVGMKVVRDGKKTWVQFQQREGRVKFTFGFVRADDFARYVPEILDALPK